MGLVVSPNCFEGSYSSFHDFRIALAKAAGIPLALLPGFYRSPKYRPVRGPLGPVTDFDLIGDNQHLETWATVVAPLLPLAWETYQADPIVILLNHSDSDGDIPRELQLSLAARLLRLSIDIDERWQTAAVDFACGLRSAWENRSEVLFG